MAAEPNEREPFGPEGPVPDFEAALSNLTNPELLSALDLALLELEKRLYRYAHLGPIGTLRVHRPYLHGLSSVEVERLAETVFSEEILPRLSSTGVARVRDHLQRNHLVALPDLRSAIGEVEIIAAGIAGEGRNRHT